MLDRFARDWYYLQFRLRLIQLKRTDFESWFSDLMEPAFPGAFTPVRLTQGDGGLDGFDFSTGTAYQVYAPRDTQLAALNSKIKNDFAAAKGLMGNKLKRWVFVHNDSDGIAHETTEILASLREENPQIEILIWKEHEIWNVAKHLSQDVLKGLFGAAPTMENLKKLQFEDLIPVLKFIQRQPIPTEPPLTPPSAQKLEFNQLSVDVADFLRNGRRRADLVQKYFSVSFEPEMGEEIAEAFRQRYRSLRDANISPDEIFDGLFVFTGGEHFTSLNESAAVAAVLSHFFDCCDIFENPESDDE